MQSLCDEYRQKARSNRVNFAGDLAGSPDNVNSDLQAPFYSIIALPSVGGGVFAKREVSAAGSEKGARCALVFVAVALATLLSPTRHVLAQPGSELLDGDTSGSYYAISCITVAGSRSLTCNSAADFARGDSIKVNGAGPGATIQPPVAPRITAACTNQPCLANGHTEYRYVVAAVDTEGAVTGAGPPAELADGPDGLNSQGPLIRYNTLQWPPVTGADRYCIYRGGSSGAELVLAGASPTAFYNDYGQLAGNGFGCPETSPSAAIPASIRTTIDAISSNADGTVTLVTADPASSSTFGTVVEHASAATAPNTVVTVPAVLPGAATSISFGPTGLQSLKHDGLEYLKDGGCVATVIDLRDASGAPLGLPVGPFKTTVSGRSVTNTYSWGSVRCAYSVAGDRVGVDVYVGNTTPYTLLHLTLRLLTLMPPTSSAARARLTNTKGNLEGTDVLSLSYGRSALVVANTEVARFLNLAAQQLPDGVPIVLGSTGLAHLMSAELVASTTAVIEYKPRTVEITRPIGPGRSDHYAMVVAFGKEGDSPRALLGNLFPRVATTFRATLKWSDRRPIGMLVLASHSNATPFNPLNPRYWAFVNPSLDIGTATGRADFQTRLLAEADRTVAILKKANAQGVIVWDIEGQQFRQPVSYVGDPRQLPPEMQGVADQFFKRFTDAGLRCGVTIRPQAFSISPDGLGHQLTSDASGTMVKTLDDKIQYAQNRWKCTLFYIDSTGDPGWPIDTSIFRSLATKHPNVLLSPENKTLVDYGVTAPYDDVRNFDPSKQFLSSDQGRWVYPRAFGIIDVVVAPNEGSAVWQNLVEAVRSGDILMFPAWWNNPQGQAVLGIYREASRSQ